MTEHFIDLTDGTRLDIKVNFGTLYYLQKTRGFNRLAKKIEKAPKKMTDSENMDACADIIYAILRSNGRSVTFDEALALMPPNPEELKTLLKGFQENYEKYAKKKRRRLGSRCQNNGLRLERISCSSNGNGDVRRRILEGRPFFV